MYVKTKEDEIAALAKGLRYIGARPLVIAKIVPDSKPYFVRLRYECFPKANYFNLFQIGKTMICSVGIGNDGLYVQFSSEELARAFANGLTILKEVS